MANRMLGRKLAYLKARQLDGAHMLCPRCGLNRMKVSIHTNALSRHADIYICDPCGCAEAMLDFIGKTVPVDEWAVFNSRGIDDHFIDTPAAQAWKEIQREQLPYLINLYKRFRSAPSGSGFSSYRQAAYANCPGLELLMATPFYAKYEVKEGQLVIRFRSDEGEDVLVSHEVIPA